MKRFFLLGAAVSALAACQPAIPDSAVNVVDTGRGVGFQNYQDYAAAREAQLQGRDTVTTVRAPRSSIEVDTRSLDAQSRVQSAAANSGVAPVQASPANPAPRVVANSVGISGENDFEAVSGQRDIAADAAMIARNRAQYTIIQPTDLPTRDGSDAPNIVEYALRTTNPVGVALYDRPRFANESRTQQACSAYASWDLAQEAFLAEGGPQKDKRRLDPDGDGFACGWDPRPFRLVRGG